MGFGIKSVNPIIINILISRRPRLHQAKKASQFTPAALGTNSNAQIAVDKGDTEFARRHAELPVPAVRQGAVPPIVNFYEYTYPYKWDVAVKPESGIQKYEDLKGKKIGVSDLGTTDYPVTRAVLQNLGIDPDKDVNWTAVGAGVSAGVALQRGVIDALAYFDTGFGQIDAAGIAMRMLPRPANVPLIGGLFISATREFPQGQPQDRASASPARSTRRPSSCWPIRRPARAPSSSCIPRPRRAAPARQMRSSRSCSPRTAASRSTSRPIPTPRWASSRKPSCMLDAKFLGLEIKDIKPMFTNDMIDEINNYDRDKIIAQAKAYKI